MIWHFVFFFKQKTAYEMRISDWSSDVCSSDLAIFKEWHAGKTQPFIDMLQALTPLINSGNAQELMGAVGTVLKTMPKLSAPNPEVLVETVVAAAKVRSEENTSELHSLMRISYAVFCLKQKNWNHAYTSKHLRTTPH